MTLGYLFIRYLWYNKEQQFVMSTEKKDGPRSRVRVFLELKVLKFLFLFFGGIISHAMKEKKRKGEAEVKGTYMYK